MALLLGQADDSPKASRAEERAVFVGELRRHRSQRTYHDLDAMGDAEDEVTLLASSPSCISEGCCLPITPFSGATSLSTPGQSTSKESSTQNVQAATSEHSESLGLPSLEESGWVREDTPAFAHGFSLKQREYLSISCKVFGAHHVQREGHNGDGMLMTFPKAEMPGTMKQVQTLLGKLEKVNHVNVVRLLQACEDEGHVYLIFEALHGAGLLPMQFLEERCQLASPEAAKLVSQLAAGMVHTKRLGMDLIDWSLWNVMSERSDSLLPVKLFGVGLAGVLHRPRRSCVSEEWWVRRGSAHYTSPELSRLLVDPDFKDMPFKKMEPSQRAPSDVWSLGAVLYMSMLGHPPYGGANEAEVLQRAITLPLVIGKGCTDLEPGGLDLLEQMLSRNPKARPRMQDIITHPWVVSFLRASVNRDMALRVIKQLSVFAKQPPVLRTVGKLLVGSLRPEKLKGLADTFYSMDLHGDGELEARELCELVTTRHTEIHALFGEIDENHSRGLSIDEFVLANILGQDVLTERMLKQTFQQIDEDGTGEITALELFRCLRQHRSDLTPDMVAAFMGDAAKDMEKQIDFETFRGFFPPVPRRGDMLMQRSALASELLQFGENNLEALSTESLQWRQQTHRLSQKAIEKREIAQADSEAVKHRDWGNDLQELVRKLSQLVRRTPRPQVEKEVNEAIQECAAKLGQVRAKAKLGGVDKGDRAGAGTGMLLFGKSLRLCQSEWLRQASQLLDRAASTEREFNRPRRRIETIVLLSDIEDLCKELLDTEKHQLDEQADMLQASEMEASMPEQPFVRRGRPAQSIDEGKAAAAIERSRRERMLTATKHAQQMVRRRTQHLPTMDGKGAEGVGAETAALVEAELNEAEKRSLAFRTRWAARAERKAASEAARLEEPGRNGGRSLQCCWQGRLLPSCTPFSTGR